MSIIANINARSVSADGRFIRIENSYKDYTEDLKQHFTNIVRRGGSDHFISTFNDIDSIVLKFNNNINNLKAVMEDIKNIPTLYSWLSAVLCAVIYGFDGQNSLHIKSIPFETTNALGNVTAIQGMEYLKVWKEKFDAINSDASQDRQATQSTNTNESDATYTDGQGNGFNSSHSLNLLAFGDDYSDFLGCFSDYYFVVPLREFNLSTHNRATQWKNKYFEMCSNHDNLETYLKNNLNVRQKILLNLSAMSISNTAPKPLKLVKAIIQRYVDINSCKINIMASPPAFMTICGVQFYKTSTITDLDSLIAENIYIGLDIKNDGKKIYRATYPITDVFVESLKEQSTYVDNISFRINTDNENKITGAEFGFKYHSNLRFLTIGTNGPTVSGNILYEYSVARTYDVAHIRNIKKLQTLCMYPNLPSEYEDRCSNYTYFSVQDSNILTTGIKGFEQIDLSNGTFYGNIDNTGDKKLILNKFDGADDAVYRKKRTFFSKKNNEVNTIYTTTATVPEHFIEVRDNQGRNCGYFLNIRTLDNDIPPLLSSSETVDFKISVTNSLPEGKNKAYAYIDYGSSTSCVKFRINNGDLIDTMITNCCTLRTLLAEYAKNDYKLFINDPVLNNHTKFMSISNIYDCEEGIRDYAVYRDGWMPVTKNLTGYESIDVLSSGKVELAKTANKSATIIINNLCYIIACNAVSMNCNEVYIVPSLPSVNYKRHFFNILTDAIRNIKKMFPKLTIHNTLDTDSNDSLQFLFESIAVSNGIDTKIPGSVMINIDMGDGTTDMSAIYIDMNQNVRICGHSSIEYAGKNLIKTTVRDIMKNCVSKEVVEKMLKGELNYGDSLFTPDNEKDEQDYEGKVNNLIKSFFNNNGVLLSENQQNYDSWENKVMDILAISNLKENIDQKVAANLILRYMLLMPVIKDFIKVAKKIAGVDDDVSIHIKFVGGSAKGIKLLNVIDSHRSTKAGDILIKYFKKEFGDSTQVDGVAPAKNPKDGKDILIDGLAMLKVDRNIAGTYTITPNNVAGNQIVAVNWKEEIDPLYYDKLGDTIHQNALNVPFTSLTQENNSIQVAQDKNKRIINSPGSYYNSKINNTDGLFNEFTDYFNNEIYEKLINDGDGNPDIIEMLIQNFANNASPGMKSAIVREMIYDSFVYATRSDIYPEMIKSAIFMFTTSKILSDYHGRFRSDYPIKSTEDVTGYEFGG